MGQTERTGRQGMIGGTSGMMRSMWSIAWSLTSSASTSPFRRIILVEVAATLQIWLQSWRQHQ